MRLERDLVGVFDFLKNKKTDATYMKMLNGITPVFSQFGNDIYASDVVQQALYTIVTEMKKLRPRHVRRDQFDIEPVWSDIQRVLEHPNPLMTKSDFIEKVTWNLLLNYNSFIYVERNNKGKVMSLYPISPIQVTFLESPIEMYVEMIFENGQIYTVPYNSLIHIKSHTAFNDLMGGDENGQPNNRSLLKTLQMNETLLDGVQKSLKAGFAINAIVTYKTMIDQSKIDKRLKEFEEQLSQSNSGFIGMDNKAEIVQFKRDLQMVDDSTLKFVDEKILRHFGVPMCILTGDFTSEQYEAFYQKTLEPLVIAFSEAFTKGLFSANELAHSNEIIFYPKELIFMNTTQTLEMINMLGQSGTLYENEKRIALGLEPLEELKGVRLQSLNYVDVSIAKQYQLELNKDNGGMESE